MSKEKTKGVLLIACGHPNYGKMAAQLALSIKQTTDLKVAIAHDGKALSQLPNEWLSLFDITVPIPFEMRSVGGFEQHIKSKLHIYDLSPFDTTIFLDADMILTPYKSLNTLFNELESVDFTMQNRGSKDINETFEPLYCFWMNIEDMKAAYNFKEGKYFRLASEFIYFKKTKAVAKLFADAIEAYEKPKLKFIKFAGGIADEAVFSISMLKNNLYPHLENFTPIYWEQAHNKRLKGADLNNTYFGYSLGGVSTSDGEKKIYDNYVQFFCNQKGLQNQYKAKSKAAYNPDRQVI